MERENMKLLKFYNGEIKTETFKEWGIELFPETKLNLRITYNRVVK
jgi:hypothetical protein